MKHDRQTGGFTGLDPERHHVLDLKVNRVADPNRVPQAVLAHLDQRPLDTEVPPTDASRACIRPPSAPENTPPSFSACSLNAAASMNTPRLQLPSVITLGVSATAATVRPLTSVPSISPSLS